VRLVDLRTGANTHSLTGHSGAVLSVAWNPAQANILASGGSDGTVRLWDIRRSASCLGVLDFEDSVGIMAQGSEARPRQKGSAHVGACNGIAWTDNGEYLVSTGHDERIRVWNTAIGANTLAHFGPSIKNAHLSTLLPLLVPSHLTVAGRQIMFYPNEREILMFDLFEGKLHKRFRRSDIPVAQPWDNVGQNIRHRVTSLAWRSGHIELYSAHSDGVIRTWLPRTVDDAEFEAEENAAENEEDESRKRKRDALSEVFRDLSRQKITFT
jgi:DNA excision repair protein ERCC-8